MGCALGGKQSINKGRLNVFYSSYTTALRGQVLKVYIHKRTPHLTFYPFYSYLHFPVITYAIAATHAISLLASLYFPRNSNAKEMQVVSGLQRNHKLKMKLTERYKAQKMNTPLINVE